MRLPESETADGERLVRWLRQAVIFLLLVGLGACIIEGANRPDDPVLRGLAPSRVAGFDQVAFRIQVEGGLPSTTDFCALLAHTDAQRAQGLMRRTDLAGYDAMIFRFPSNTTSGFWMRNTPLPLSIAWFDERERFVSAADMAPCDDRPDCPSYAAGGPYRLALEVPQGGFDRLGVGPGAVLDVGGACG